MSCDSTNKRSTHRLKRADKTQTSNKYINKSIIIKKRMSSTNHRPSKWQNARIVFVCKAQHLFSLLYPVRSAILPLPPAICHYRSLSFSSSAYIMQHHAIVLRKDVLVRHVSENDTACNSVFFLSIFLLKLSYRSQQAICDKAAAATERPKNWHS